MPSDPASILSRFEFAWQHLLIVALIIQRLAELVISGRNARALLRRGAHEVGREHYPAIVTLHAIWFLGMIVETVILTRGISRWWWAFLLLFVAAQGLRYWTIRTLGGRWTTRILILPGVKSVTKGPFRFVRHPNYLAVVVELVAFPLIYNAFITAVTTTIINAVLLRIRIRKETEALRRNA